MGLSMKEVSDDDSSQVFNNWLQAGPSETPKPTIKRTHQQILQLAEALNCPRCNSSNTKFCYYNNYNRTQPRHFCKACKRHWTKGGTLRNVPVGGGRKNKRHKTSHDQSSATTTNKINPPIITSLYDQDHHQLSFLDHDDNALIYNRTTTDQSYINHSDHQLPMQLSFSGTINHHLTPNISIYIDQKLENYMEDQSSSVINPGININDAWEFEVAEGSTSNNTISSLSSSVLMELPSSSYWNWNKFENTVGDFSIPNWDGTEIKP